MAPFKQSNSASKPNSDRRCGPRLGITLPVKFSKPFPLNGKLIDISFCGCGVLIDHPFQPRDELLVHLNLPSEDGYVPIELNCEVARCTPIRGQYLTGLSFRGIKPHQAHEINAFFHYHQRFSA